MRYIKVLLLAAFIFFALIFFFQNQGPLSQEMQLSLNLFFIPPITSISLPFYFIVVAAFFVGCVLSLLWLLWDKFTTSAKLVKTRWRVSSLENEVAKLKRQMEKMQPQKTTPELPAASTPKEAPVPHADSENVAVKK